MRGVGLDIRVALQLERNREMKSLNWLWVKMQVAKEQVEKKPLHKGAK